MNKYIYIKKEKQDGKTKASKMHTKLATKIDQKNERRNKRRK